MKLGFVTAVLPDLDLEEVLKFAAEANFDCVEVSCWPKGWDEWPGGRNLAICPAIWRRMFEEIPDERFGLNYDPSHMIWQQMDEVAPVWEFAPRFHHMHAKDVRLDRRKLDEVGILAIPLAYHRPKLPGLGDVRWGALFSALTDAGYDGPICVEVEDRAYEGSLEDRKRALRQSAMYLRQFMGRT